MKTGHRGVNYPVRVEGQRRGEITVQHHSFVVDGTSVPGSATVTHVNVNDGTIEGIRSRDCEAWSVQFHPSRDEFGLPSEVLKKFVMRS
jgi:carbamoyl-phosphate synthase small subunit